MSLRTNSMLFASFFFTLVVKRLFGPFYLRSRWIRSTEFLPREKLEKLQLALLKKVIAHAYRTVPFYARYMKERGMQPSDIAALKDIEKFPILTKEDLRRLGSDLYSSSCRPWMRRIATTGGTTGIPTEIARDVFSIGSEHAFVRRQYSFAGIKLHEKTAFLSAREIRTRGKYHGRYYYYDPFMKELVLSSYHLCEESARDYLYLIAKYGVRTLNGHPSSISFLANVAVKNAVRLRMKAVLTTSEILSPLMRETIEDAFGCRVYDYFGSAERVCCIQTCEKGTYHVLPEYGYTEFLPSDCTPGEFRIVSTGFWNRAMPLIRYDMGDNVRKSGFECPCGRHYETVDSISGRDGSAIVTPSGIVLNVVIVIHMFYMIGKAADLLEIQIIQDESDHATILYVPAGNADEPEMERVARVYIPEEMRLSFSKVERVRRTSSGKAMPLISSIV
jgi:phenylacetate-CoA ligase